MWHALSVPELIFGITSTLALLQLSTSCAPSRHTDTEIVEVLDADDFVLPLPRQLERPFLIWISVTTILSKVSARITPSAVDAQAHTALRIVNGSHGF